MRNYVRNIAHNPRFRLWPFGTSGFTVSGKTGAARWKLERTDASDVVTISRGYNPSPSSYDKWMQGQPHMRIDVTGLSASSTLRIMQPQEALSYFGRCLITMSVVASGPPGATFKFGVGGRYVELTTLGEQTFAATYAQSGTTITVSRTRHGYSAGDRVTLAFTSGSAPSGEYVITTATVDAFVVTAASATTSGNVNIVVPIMVTGTGRITFADPAHEYMRVVPFESPSQTGTFRLHYVDVSVASEADAGSSEFELRPDWIEWKLIERYITPITAGMMGVALATNDYLHVPVTAPRGGWRVAPVLATEGRAAGLVAYRLSTSLLHTSATPSMSLFATPAADKFGCNVQIGPFASPALTSGAQYVLGGNPDEVIAYLNADYF